MFRNFISFWPSQVLGFYSPSGPVRLFFWPSQDKMFTIFSGRQVLALIISLWPIQVQGFFLFSAQSGSSVF
jgi:hypothetical protein